MSDSEDEDGLGLGAVFTEPPRPPSPEPTFSTYKRVYQWLDRESQWDEVKVRLVGNHPLWGHYLWNASRSFASYLDLHLELYSDRTVLELGAGGGLPGIVAAKNGARKVVLTDYPDAALVDNLAFNVKANVDPEQAQHVAVKGYIWGKPVAPLLDVIKTPAHPNARFDLIIMSDLIFNHSQHDALLNTCEQALSTADLRPGPCLLVFYSHHRPRLAERDLDFFRKARERGWHCEEEVVERYPPMFPDDPGEEEVRATVHGWKLVRA
ncbi:hypothetical protein DENSPDRAFT_843387 [Dentipellis sp. KUC8613]|nr:hypothetical protein DENSPDRAFT_843387 [Dentipellis sp. KUC8613]